MTRTPSLVACALGTLLIAVAYASAFVPGGPLWGAWCMVVGIALLSTGCIALGTWHRRRRSRLLMAALAGTALVIIGGFGLALALPGGEGPGTRRVLGLPVRAAAVLYGVGVVPLFLLPLVYAFTFEGLTLTEDDLARVRAARRPGAGD